jgi:hypothetical protein
MQFSTWVSRFKQQKMINQVGMTEFTTQLKNSMFGHNQFGCSFYILKKEEMTGTTLIVLTTSPIFKETTLQEQRKILVNSTISSFRPTSDFLTY